MSETNGRPHHILPLLWGAILLEDLDWKSCRYLNRERQRQNVSSQLSSAFETRRDLRSNSRQSYHGPVTFLGYGSAWPVRIKRLVTIHWKFNKQQRQGLLKIRKIRTLKCQKDVKMSKGPLDVFLISTPGSHADTDKKCTSELDVNIQLDQYVQHQIYDKRVIR